MDVDHEIHVLKKIQLQLKQEEPTVKIIKLISEYEGYIKCLIKNKDKLDRD